MELQKKRKKKKKLYTIAERQNFLLTAVTAMLLVAALVATLVFMGQYGFSFTAFLKGDDGKQQVNATYQEVNPNLIDKSNFLVIGESDGSTYMRYYALIQVNLESGTLGVCSLPTTLSLGNQSLTDVYRKSGGTGAKEALATYLGIRIDRYMGIKDSDFKKLVSRLGKPTYTFAERIKFSTSGEDAYAVRIKPGEQELDGGQILKLFRYSGEEQKDFKLQNELLAAGIDAVLTEENYKKSETLFNTMINYMDTDMVINDYTAKREALEALCNPSYSLSSQLITTEGTYDANGGFTMSSDMLQAVKTQFYKER